MWRGCVQISGQVTGRRGRRRGSRCGHGEAAVPRVRTEVQRLVADAQMAPHRARWGGEGIVGVGGGEDEGSPSRDPQVHAPTVELRGVSEAVRRRLDQPVPGCVSHLHRSELPLGRAEGSVTLVHDVSPQLEPTSVPAARPIASVRRASGAARDSICAGRSSRSRPQRWTQSLIRTTSAPSATTAWLAMTASVSCTAAPLGRSTRMRELSKWAGTNATRRPDPADISRAPPRLIGAVVRPVASTRRARTSSSSQKLRPSDTIPEANVAVTSVRASPVWPSMRWSRPSSRMANVEPAAARLTREPTGISMAASPAAPTPRTCPGTLIQQRKPGAVDSLRLPSPASVPSYEL